MNGVFGFLLLGLVISFFPGPITGQPSGNLAGKKGYRMEKFEHRDLANWSAYGLGAIEANHGQTVMFETEGSLGFMLVSPLSYGENTIVTFDVMTLNAATVLVAEMAAHTDPSFNLNLEAGYDGNVKYLFENVRMYMFAFHNAAHNKTGPFVRKYPEPGTKPLMAASKNVMQTGKYHHVEMGTEEGSLWFKIDGKRVWKVKDPEPLEGGKVILRIRGTAHETASCIIKNLKIYSKG